MKRILYLILLLSTFLTGYAQELKPGQQAQGCLDNKDVLVDHATGIFHYSVPLYTISTGEYKLPLSLNYAANGVRREDPFGIAGNNWNLSLGGMVTRVLRGGNPDEHPIYGYTRGERDGVTFRGNETKVNRHELDGEADIFTATFNGQTVNFIIHIDSNKKVYADPLEQTNVRIEGKYNGVDIYEWILTDESGNKYFYALQEWTRNALQDEAITLYGFKNLTYTSSWYLTKIELQNGDPINFEYGDIRKEVHISRSESKYEYGRPMVEHTFSFAKYQQEYSSEIGMAMHYITKEINDILTDRWNRLSQYESAYGSMSSWITAPYISLGSQKVETYSKFMGILGNLQDIGKASDGIIETLYSIENSCSLMGSQQSSAASKCLSVARAYIYKTFQETQSVKEKTTYNGTSYWVDAPLPKIISCGGQKYIFSYIGYDDSRMLSKIECRDIFGKTMSTVKFLMNWYNLQKVSYCDKDDRENNSLSFDYYDLPLNVATATDLWGYTRDVSELEKTNKNVKFWQHVNPDFAKNMSLKQIRMKNGARLGIDYESNRLDSDSETNYGGIRLKSLVFADSTNCIADTIHYEYPLAGHLVYYDYYNTETLRYGSFSDFVRHTAVRYTGAAYVNIGNNGIYYPYVTETRKGKGMKSFLFYVPFLRTSSYPFWLFGLPLGTAAYDENGAIKQLVVNHYDADITQVVNSNAFPIKYASFFKSNGIAPKYKKELQQQSIYEFYMNEKDLDDYYKKEQEKFSSNYPQCARYANIYYDIYYQNIYPRTSIKVPDFNYRLSYGGKVLLKEQLEYRFETPVTQQADHRDFYNEDLLKQPFSKKEFFYDNLDKSVLPTRTEYTDAKGDIYTTEEKRVTEFTNYPDSTIQEMVQKNIWLPVLKQKQVKNGNLLEEVINEYTFVPLKNTNHLFLNKRYALACPDTEAHSGDSLFTYSRDKYRLEKQYEFVKNNNLVLPGKETSRADTSLVVYDPSGNNVIFKTSCTSSGNIFVYDLNKFNMSYGERVLWNFRVDLRQTAAWLCDLYEHLDESLLDEKNISYLRGPDGYRLYKLIRAMSDAQKTTNIDGICRELEEIRKDIDKYFKMCELLTATKYISDKDNNDDERLPRFHKWGLNYEGAVNRQYFEEIERFNYEELLSPIHKIEIKDFSKSDHIRFYILKKDDSNASLRLEITRTSGLEVGSINANKTFGIYDIDLTSYQNASSIKITNWTGGAYVAIVPSEITFEATSYNIDDTVHAKFDATGKLELYEYDTVGRLIRVKDQNDHIVKEYTYNNISNN